MDTFLTVAMEQARKSTTSHKHGSVLFCKNQMFTGYSHYSDNASVSGGACMTVHAEEHAINNFIKWCKRRGFSDSYMRRKLKNSTLFTVRVKDDRVKYSLPCSECVKLIQKHEIKQVVYSDQPLSTRPINIVSRKTRDLPDSGMSSGYRRIERMRNGLNF